MYVYIYIYNRHLGLISAPLICVFLQTTFVTIHLLSKRPDIYTILAKTLFIWREIPAVHLGGHLGDHPHICMYVCIYIYIYNPHLGLIKAPLILFFLQTALFTINVLSNRSDIY